MGSNHEISGKKEIKFEKFAVPNQPPTSIFDDNGEVYIYIYTYTNIYVYIVYIYKYVYIHTYIYIYIYIYT
jgi:hypothetical protein